jgi:hypothetical protein
MKKSWNSASFYPHSQLIIHNLLKNCGFGALNVNRDLMSLKILADELQKLYGVKLKVIND